MQPLRTYIDTNVLKFSATELARFQPRRQALNWGSQVGDLTVYDPVTVNPNESIANPTLKREAALLRELAVYGKTGQIQYVLNMETDLESWSLPNMDSNGGRFYNTPIEWVKAPIKYGRVVISGNADSKYQQFRFLSSLEHPRFLELQKMTGAYQGPRKFSRNQLLDAFHLWCAEHNHCSFFLTLDFKLLKVLRRGKSQPNVRAIKPSELLAVCKLE